MSCGPPGGAGAGVVKAAERKQVEVDAGEVRQGRDRLSEDVQNVCDCRRGNRGCEVILRIAGPPFWDEGKCEGCEAGEMAESGEDTRRDTWRREGRGKLLRGDGDGEGGEGGVVGAVRERRERQRSKTSARSATVSTLARILASSSSVLVPLVATSMSKYACKVSQWWSGTMCCERG